MAEKVKKKMATDIKIFIAISIVIALILGAAIVYLVTPKDVAIVKNNKVTNAEFKFYYTQNLQYYSMFAGQVDQQTIVDTAKQQTLNQVVEIEYLLQEAEKEGFVVSKEDIDTAWSEMDQNLKSSAEAYGGSVNEISEQLFGVKYNQAKNIYKDYITSQKYREKVINEMQLDETELTTFYEENKTSFDFNTVSHILISCEKEAEDSVAEEKKKTAHGILDRVNQGEDFAELAKEFSEDPGSAETGGQYDVKQNGQMVPEFEEWVFSHDIGETGLIRTDHGFHVMKLDSINNTFEAVKDSVENSLKVNKYQMALQETLNEGDYQVEIKEGYNEF